MDELTKTLKGEFVNGLLHYFNNDATKVKKFANQLKVLGFDVNDRDTLEAFTDRSEALIVLLGLSNFGILSTIGKSIMHLRGAGNPDEYLKQYVEKFVKLPAPN